MWATAKTNNNAPVSVFTTVQGTGQPLTNAQLFGGGTADGSIEVTLRDASGNPIVGYPAADITLDSILGELTHCPTFNTADAATDATGTASFALERFAGGFTDPNVGDRPTITLPGISGPGPGAITLVNANIDRRIETLSRLSCDTTPIQTCSEQSSAIRLPLNDLVQCSTSGVSQATQNSDLDSSDRHLLAEGAGSTLALPVVATEYQAALSRYSIQFDLDRNSSYSYSYNLAVSGPNSSTTFSLESVPGIPILLDSGSSSGSGTGRLEPGTYRLYVEAITEICDMPGTQETANWDFSFNLTPADDVLYNPRLLASTADQIGNAQISVLNPATGVANTICALPWGSGAADLEYDSTNHRLWVHASGGGFQIAEFDPATCSLITGPVATPGRQFQALEFIEGVLYGAYVSSVCDLSTLATLDPDTGVSTNIGLTNLGPISGLAWNPHSDILYGVTGCSLTFGPSGLYILDRATGLATSLVGNTGVVLGGLSYGPDGRLYGVGANQDGGNLYVIDAGTGAATLVGASGLPGMSGLTVLSDPGLNVFFNSPDLDGDGGVDIVDVAVFATDLVSRYRYRSDFFWDGTIDLGDIGPFSSAIGGFCPQPKGGSVASIPRSMATMGVYFDRSATSTALELDPGETAVGHVLLQGPLAAGGIEAWEARLATGDNVVVESWTFPENAHRFGEGEDLLVGMGHTRASVPGKALVLGTFRFHVTDAAPAQFHLRGTDIASAGDGPALVLANGKRAQAVETAGASSRDALALVNGRGRSGDSASVTTAVSFMNSPNPFNPKTTLAFNLPRQGDVTVRIFDAAGRLVRQLQGGTLTAGAQQLSWDGSDDRGSIVGSGMYYASLLLDGSLLGDSIKMALLK